jgi:hypothetical protein
LAILIISAGERRGRFVPVGAVIAPARAARRRRERAAPRDFMAEREVLENAA